MNKILKLTFILFLICAITAGILGGVNELTKDRIYAIQNAATIAAYSAVLEADGYDELDFDAAAFPTVDKVSKATNDAGHVVELTVSGAQGVAVVGLHLAEAQRPGVRRALHAGEGAPVQQPAAQDRDDADERHQRQGAVVPDSLVFRHGLSSGDEFRRLTR